MRFVILLGLFLTTFAQATTYPVLWKANPFKGSKYIVPNDTKKHTSIILLHGSEGGSEPFLSGEANILAMQGYGVLLYCYFDCGRGLNGPRETLKNVEVTKLLDATAWLRTQAGTNGKVVVYGFSRGAELTMIVGSLPATEANKPDALIAHSPTDVFNGAWNWSWSEPSCWLCKKGSGNCSESSPYSDFEWNQACGPDDPNMVSTTESAWKISGVTVPLSQRIEIEKFGRPIMITMGEADEIWPVDQAKRIEATLKANHRPLELHLFPGAGHSFYGKDELTRRELVLDFLQRVP